jgi:hypothetical protein
LLIYLAGQRSRSALRVIRVCALVMNIGYPHGRESGRAGSRALPREGGFLSGTDDVETTRLVQAGMRVS